MSGTAVEWRVFADPAALGRAAADRIATGIAAANAAGRPYVLGCPGGRSALSTYAALAAAVARHRLDLSRLVIAMMDEYLVEGPGGRLERVAADLPYSCLRFARDEICAPLSRAAGPGRGIPAANLWLPDPQDPAAYDEQLAAAGGIDLFLLACGASDGHVAFNPPGSDPDSRTRVVALAEETRRDNVVTFPSFGAVDAVPRHGVSVGIGTIRDLSRSATMVLHGADKAVAAGRLAAADGYDPAWPATVVTDCAAAAVLVDRAAAAGIPDGVAGTVPGGASGRVSGGGPRVGATEPATRTTSARTTSTPGPPDPPPARS